MTDKQLIKFTTNFRHGLIGKQPSTSKCFMVSAPLQSILELSGVKTELVEMDFFIGDYVFNHVFLKLPNGQILDATADQFPEAKLPKVYLGAIPEIYLEWVAEAQRFEVVEP